MLLQGYPQVAPSVLGRPDDPADRLAGLRPNGDDLTALAAAVEVRRIDRAAAVEFLLPFMGGVAVNGCNVAHDLTS